MLGRLLGTKLGILDEEGTVLGCKLGTLLEVGFTLGWLERHSEAQNGPRSFARAVS